MKKIWLLGLLGLPLVACELVADFDRTKIPAASVDSGPISEAGPILDAPVSVDAPADTGRDAPVVDSGVDAGADDASADATDDASDGN